RYRLEPLVGNGVDSVRTRGLWAGVDISPALMTGREACERLLERGVLAKDTHGSTIRFAPPLTIEADELDWMVDQFAEIL
ncbi:MAG TPA: aminotransferase class III-fold pyridoxal phosphate-dependent enzyme, partial [Actinomycetales bacterium]|nr:aminotransferase class III-fold pyridoxal phosphate-dependent enzyme [Actinomycetales bacterium]